MKDEDYTRRSLYRAIFIAIVGSYLLMISLMIAEACGT